jgi:hypothetical protein
MSDNTPFGFAKFVPGFDFLQNIAKGATQGMPQMPNLSNWIAPTLSVEELEKRISELKAVHFWLDQNGKALAATIQALEVQKMTLATLQGMNFNMGEVANALKVRTAETMASGAQKAGDAAGKVSGAAETARRKAEPKAKPGAKSGNGPASPVDPMQWWGALTQQFQEIAANAMKDVAQKTAVDPAKNPAAVAAKDTAKHTAKDTAKAAKKSAPRKAARKTAKA